MELRHLIESFESDLVPSLLDKAPIEQVFFGTSRLAKTDFGKAVRGVIESPEVFAVDYYGLFKKSLGFELLMIDAKQRALELNQQVRFIRCPVVHFASITVEDVVRSWPAFLVRFPALKEQLLQLRGFKK